MYFKTIVIIERRKITKRDFKTHQLKQNLTTSWQQIEKRSKQKQQCRKHNINPIVWRRYLLHHRPTSWKIPCNCGWFPKILLFVPSYSNNDRLRRCDGYFGPWPKKQQKVVIMGVSASPVSKRELTGMSFIFRHRVWPYFAIPSDNCQKCIDDIFKTYQSWKDHNTAFLNVKNNPMIWKRVGCIEVYPY